MVQFLQSSQPDPIAAGLQQALGAIGQGLQQRSALQAQERRSQALQNLLMGSKTTRVGDEGDFNVSGPESDLSRLEDMENAILASGPLTPETKAVLQSVRSRRNVIAQQLNAGENESARLAAKRRSENIDALSGKAEAADSTLQAVSQLEGLVEGGGTGPSVKNALINATDGHEGLLGAINGFMTTVESQGFKSAQLAFFPQLKKLFGGRVTDRDLKTFMDSLARFGTDPKAQKLALQTLKQHAEFDVRLGEHVLTLIDDEGRPVRGFEKKLAATRKELNKEMSDNFQAFSEELGITPSGESVVKFRDPQGRLFSIPRKDKKSISAAKKQGFKVES